MEIRDFPDLIIGGAMKSGTSSLHVILGQHPEIFIPEGEVHFFCMDDIVQHTQFFGPSTGAPVFEPDSTRILNWYASFFEPARGDQLIGEDSTIYLASTKAPKRIKKILPDVKLIFMLRHPVDRTYSHYWHLVRTGRAVYSFEQELRFGPNTLHQRSFYRQQLERYFDLFPRNQIKVILFERFVQDTQAVVDEVCSYLGLSTSVDVDAVDTHANASRMPRWHRLQLFLNYASQGLWNRYESHLPGSTAADETSVRTRILRSLFYRLRNWNLRDTPYPPMAAETRASLSDLYARENRGLDDLIPCDLEKYWSLS